MCALGVVNINFVSADIPMYVSTYVAKYEELMGSNTAATSWIVGRF